MKQRKVLPGGDSRPIGVFDSGVGGLTVVKELTEALPFEDIVYYGDTARVPYGTKSRNTIIRFSVENAAFLLGKGVKLIVAACNTSSSVSLPALRRYFNVPVVGVIKPGASDAVRACRNKRIGVIATTATIKSNVYNREIARIDPRIRIFSRACPLLVPVVEESLSQDGIISDIVAYYLKPIRQRRVDTLVLGCTHYPLLRGFVSRFMGRSVTLVDSASSTAGYVKGLLGRRDALNQTGLRPRINFFVSDEIGHFKRTGERFLGRRIRYIGKAGYGLQG
jgi:glutamate racemase